MQAISLSDYYEECAECQCYKLTKCGDSGTVVWSNSDLSAYVGDVIDYDGDCYLVGPKEAPPNPEACVAVTVSDDYESCADCECDCESITYTGLPTSAICSHPPSFVTELWENLPGTLSREGCGDTSSGGGELSYDFGGVIVGPYPVSLRVELSAFGVEGGACTIEGALQYSVPSVFFFVRAAYKGTVSGGVATLNWVPGSNFPASLPQGSAYCPLPSSFTVIIDPNP